MSDITRLILTIFTLYAFVVIFVRLGVTLGRRQAMQELESAYEVMTRYLWSSDARDLMNNARIRIFWRPWKADRIRLEDNEATRWAAVAVQREGTKQRSRADDL